MNYLPLIRKIIQLAVLTLFCALPFLTSLDFAGISGSLFSLDFFGIPFADPASTLQITAQAMLEGVFPLSAVLIGAASSLLLALIMGRIFCGWICPYGLLSEFAWRHKKNWKHANRIKIGVFISALILALIGGYPVISWLSMPGQLTVAPIALREGWNACLLILLLPIFALLLDLLLGRRFFCSNLCPQSLTLGSAATLLPKFSPGLRISWNKYKCNCKDEPCEKVCQFSLKPRKTPSRFDCCMCGDCIATCNKHGKALSWSFKPVSSLSSGSGIQDKS